MSLLWAFHTTGKKLSFPYSDVGPNFVVAKNPAIVYLAHFMSEETELPITDDFYLRLVKQGNCYGA